MPELDIRRAMTGSRREGRRSQSAYGSHARGIRVLEGTDRVVRLAYTRDRRQAAVGEGDAGAWSAGIALALVYPLVRRLHKAGRKPSTGAQLASQAASEGTEMKRKPSIKSLDTVSLEEATAYLDHARGDELNAAYALACDRNRLDGSIAPPDEAEVHHALFLLCRARGRHAPSFDTMRVELRRRVAA
jgi:hypothetical protein